MRSMLSRAGIVAALAAAAIMVGPRAAGAGIIIVHKDTTPVPVEVATVFGVGEPIDRDGVKAVEIQWSDRLGALELQQIQDGVITADEARSGCGASASSGSAAGLPLALAALALVLRRRR